jgi:hypothetical protein
LVSRGLVNSEKDEKGIINYTKIWMREKDE